MLSNEIVTDENLPYLKQISKPFDFNQHNAIEVDKHIKYLIQRENAFGISGIQFSFPYRVFGIYVSPNNIETFFNPVLLEVTNETPCYDNEGCLSFPDLFLIKERPTSIMVEYHNVYGNINKIQLDNFHARGFLHELDHLNGKVFVDGVKPLALKMAKKKRNKKLKYK